MAVFAAIMTASMLTHEFAHKTMAQKNGLWAEFRLTTWGVALTFVSIFLPFRMISPGAMMIAGTPNGDEIVKISHCWTSNQPNFLKCTSCSSVFFTCHSCVCWHAVFRCLHQRFHGSLQPDSLRNLGRLQNLQFQQETLGFSFHSQR